jgi:hypothetical protein
MILYYMELGSVHYCRTKLKISCTYPRNHEIACVWFCCYEYSVVHVGINWVLCVTLLAWNPWEMFLLSLYFARAVDKLRT